MPANPCSKWFWNDWDNDIALHLCSLAAQGLWMRMLSIAARATPIGYVMVNGRSVDATDLAHVTGASEAEIRCLLDELEDRRVFSRDRHHRIYNRRMVRDDRAHHKAVQNGKDGGNPEIRRGTVPKDLRVRPFKRSDSKAKTQRIFEREDNLVASCALCNHQRARSEAIEPTLTGGGGYGRSQEGVTVGQHVGTRTQPIDFPQRNAPTLTPTPSPLYPFSLSPYSPLESPKGLSRQSAGQIAARMLEIWNRECGSIGLRKALHPDNPGKPRVAACNARFKEHFGSDMEQWTAFVRRVVASSFLTGNSTRGFRATLDWALTPMNATKILEGNYDDRDAPTVKFNGHSMFDTGPTEPPPEIEGFEVRPVRPH